MTDLPTTTSTASDRARDIRAAVESRLKIRHASERRFKLYGQLAIAIALSFLVLLLGRIVTQGASTFVVHSISVQVPALIWALALITRMSIGAMLSASSINSRPASGADRSFASSCAVPPLARCVSW